MTIEVGEIQGYPVQYVLEKDMVFCKTTICRVKDLKAAIYSSLSREYIEEKDLSIVKDRGIIYFGCLTTTLDNIEAIRRKIKQVKRNSK